MTIAFEFKQVTKTFGALIANESVSFHCVKDSIHGVVGENGAGKSTIMKVLYGLYQPDSGEVWVKGEKTHISSPHVAIDLGIGMVHQHFMLVPTLTVLQNILLGGEPSFFNPYNKQTRKRVEELQASFGFKLNLDARIEDLPVGQQQQVEILKQLYRRADILILDEPTAVLTPLEVHALFERLRELSTKGKTIVLISHKLKEILELTHTVTVMRQGRVVEHLPTSELDEHALAELIVGRPIKTLPERLTAKEDAIVLDVRSLGLKKKHGVGLKEISFRIKRGEIVGIAGVSGNGQEELIECLAAVNKHYNGSILFEGKELRESDTYSIKQQGLSVLPPDRHNEGAILDFTVFENLLLGHHKEDNYTRFGWIAQNKVAAFAEPLLEIFDVRPRNGNVLFRELSGGNQQKAVIAREVSRSSRFLIAAHPTRGVDIGAIEQIHSLFLKERDRGTAILLVSSELEEIFALADRILVMFGGSIVGEMDRASADEARIGKWMTGMTIQ